jgi:hypothetical protein
MIETVVDGLEVVEVAEQYCHLLVVAPQSGTGLSEAVVEQCPLGNR